MSSAAAHQVPMPARAGARTNPMGDQRPRTPLSVVRAVPRKRRTPFVVMCFALLALALMAVLVLNIQVSSAQYSLVQLKSLQATLTKENQELTQQVQNFQAPQNLAAKAGQLGMVSSPAKGHIDLSTLTVSGTATPAAAGVPAGAVIPAPAVAGQVTVIPSATSGDMEPDVPAGERSPAVSAAVETPAAAGAEPQNQAASVPDQVLNLNGGSVPAPAQRVPGQ